MKTELRRAFSFVVIGLLFVFSCAVVEAQERPDMTQLGREWMAFLSGDWERHDRIWENGQLVSENRCVWSGQPYADGRGVIASGRFLGANGAWHSQSRCDSETAFAEQGNTYLAEGDAFVIDFWRLDLKPVAEGKLSGSLTGNGKEGPFKGTLTLERAGGDSYTATWEVVSTATGTKTRGEEINTRLMPYKKSTFEDFLAYAKTQVNRSTAELELFKDFEGLGKKGEKMQAYWEARFTDDGKTVLGRFLGGPGSATVLISYDAGKEQIIETVSTSGGSFWTNRVIRDGDRFVRRSSGHNADGSPVEMLASMVLSEDGKTEVWTSEDLMESDREPGREVWRQLGVEIGN